MMLILQPRIGGPPTAAVIANAGDWAWRRGRGAARRPRFGSARPSAGVDDLRELESRAVVVGRRKLCGDSSFRMVR